MYRTGDHDVKWNKPYSEIQILYVFSQAKGPTRHGGRGRSVNVIEVKRYTCMKMSWWNALLCKPTLKINFKNLLEFRRVKGENLLSLNLQLKMKRTDEWRKVWGESQPGCSVSCPQCPDLSPPAVRWLWVSFASALGTSLGGVLCPECLRLLES